MKAEHLGDIIREARLRRGLTQRALADATASNARTVRFWESGQIGRAAIQRVAEVLELRPEELLAAKERTAAVRQHRVALRCYADAHERLAGLVEDPASVYTKAEVDLLAKALAHLDEPTRKAVVHRAKRLVQVKHRPKEKKP